MVAIVRYFSFMGLQQELWVNSGSGMGIPFHGKRRTDNALVTVHNDKSGAPALLPSLLACNDDV